MKKKIKSKLKDQLNLKNKIAVISGGGGYLSKFFAEAISEFGGTVILLDINEYGLRKNSKDLNKHGFSCKYFVCDVCDKTQIKKILKVILKDFKKIDILINAVNFVGINKKTTKYKNNKYFANFEDYDENLWRESLETNLTGSFLLTQMIGKIMRLR